MHEDVQTGLLALGSEWRRETPHGLRVSVAAIAEQAAGASPRFATEEDASYPWLSGRRIALATAALVALLLVVPGSRGAIARQAYRVLQTLHIAPRTDLVTFETRTPDEVSGSLRQYQRQLGAGTMWQVHTAYGGFAGVVPPNAAPAVRRIDQLEVLRSLATIPIHVPDAEYRGQPLSFHHALLAPDGLVLTFFGSGNGEVLLVQAPVDSGQQISYSRSVSGPDGVLKSVPPAIETLTIGTQRLTWDPDTTGVNPNLSALRWESIGISYSLYGRGLVKEEALALFTSLRPL
jgi:hypothetical protein